PTGPSNGFDNPDLISPGFAAEVSLSPTLLGDWDSRPYFRGLLACWAIDGGAQNQVKWNHLSGTATVFNSLGIVAFESPGAYEYTAYAFFVPTGLDLQPVGIAGTLNLNGVEYDSCPLYQIAQFTPADRDQLGAPNGTQVGASGLSVFFNRLAIAGC